MRVNLHIFLVTVSAILLSIVFKAQSQYNEIFTVNLGYSSDPDLFCTSSTKPIRITTSPINKSVTYFRDDQCEVSNVTGGSCNDIIFSGNNIIGRGFTEEPPVEGTVYINCYPYIDVRPTTPGFHKYTVSYESIWIHEASPCNPKRTFKYLFKGEITIYIFEGPPTPTISVFKKINYSNLEPLNDNDIVYTTDTLSFVANGCESIPDFQFAKKLSCDPTNLEYQENSFLLGQNYYDFLSDTPQKVTFKVRCRKVDCLGIYSDSITIRTIKKPIPKKANCNQGEKDDPAENNSDYHNYKVVKDICNKKNDPTCTVSKVYGLLKSKRYYAIPQYDDFQDLFSVGTAVGGISIAPLSPMVAGAVISNFTKGGINGIYQYNTPVEDCRKADIYSPASFTFPSKFLTPIGSDNGGTLYDPIIQSVDDNSYTVTNLTLPGHTFHPGKIMITVREDNCNVYTQVIGVGNSKVSDIWEWAGVQLSTRLNVYTGRVAFTNLLERLKNSYK